jgi:hypothetical protein
MTATPNLQGRVVAFSMSAPNDLARLGFPSAEFDRVVFNLCMRVVRAEGRILYGGHLGDDSLTARMFEYTASAYVPGNIRARAEGPKPPKPFLHLLPLSEFRRSSFARLYDIQSRFGSFLETRLITDDDKYFTLSRRTEKLMFRDPESNEGASLVGTPEDLAAFSSTLPARAPPEALTAMRAAARKLTRARIVLGGKRGDLGVAGGRDRFEGAMPGIYEETLSSVDAQTPFVLLGAYGGAARDIAIDLGLIGSDNEVPYLGEVQPQYREARAKMCEARHRIPVIDREMMAPIVLREDCEDLGRDIVAMLAHRLESAGPDRHREQSP